MIRPFCRLTGKQICEINEFTEKELVDFCRYYKLPATGSIHVLQDVVATALMQNVLDDNDVAYFREEKCST